LLSTRNDEGPLRIDYTSNSAAAVAANNSVEFSYAPRPDPLLHYQGGRGFKTSVRLAAIATKNGASTVLTYTLSYVAGAGARSTVDGLSLCAADGVCTTPTRFEIGFAGRGRNPYPGSIVLPVTQTESSASTGKWVTMDVDGDGVTDIVHFTSSGSIYRIWASNGDGTFGIREFTAAGDADLASGSWQVLDVNGDGLADLVHLTTTNGLARIWISNGDGTFAISSFSSPITEDLNYGGWLVLDVNGDGLADLVQLVGARFEAQPWQQSENFRIWKSNGNGTFEVSALAGSGGTVLWLIEAPLLENLYRSKWQVLDVDGDGLADMVQMYIDSGNFSAHVIVRRSNGDGTFGFSRTQVFEPWESNGIPNSNISRVYAWVPIDVNQDGLTDLVLHATFREHLSPGPLMSAAGLNSSISLLSKGDGTFSPLALPSTIDRPLLDGTWQVVDENGDGLADLVHTPSNLSSGQYWIWRSRGDGTFQVTQMPQNAEACSSACTDMRAGDFTADGAPGFVRLDGTTVKSIWLLGSRQSTLTTGVNNGLGQKVSWEIQVLPSILNNGYQKDLPSDSSTWTLTAPIPVVTQVRRRVVTWMDPDQSLRTLDRVTQLSYGSARVERNGRGFLGFRWRQSADSVTGLRIRTTYRQDFPYLGLVSSQSTGSGGSWDNLGTTSTSYAAMVAGLAGTEPGTSYGCRLGAESGCVAAPGKRYFVYPSEVGTEGRDLDGTALPRTRRLNADPDRYGNLRSETTLVLNPDGSATDYSTSVTSSFFNDPETWIIGRLTKRVTDRSGPLVAAPVVPGSGGLPTAQPPGGSGLSAAVLAAILQILLDDD
jgi:hypothetical protein